jgi:hypothetical protein
MSYPFGRCRRVTLNGARCTMPAHHNGDLCFDHEQRTRLVRVRRPALPDTDIREPLVKFAYMEDHASILHNLNAIALAFANHQIDHRQVGVMAYLMQTCLKTLRQMNQLEIRPTLNEIVTDVRLRRPGSPPRRPRFTRPNPRRNLRPARQPNLRFALRRLARTDRAPRRRDRTLCPAPCALYPVLAITSPHKPHNTPLFIHFRNGAQ